MKVVPVVFLFICAVGAIRNWVGLPKTDLKELDNFLEDTKSVADTATFGTSSAFGNLVNRAKYSAKHEYQDEGSGVNPTEEPKNWSIKNLVDATHSILPALKELKDAREELSQEFAKEFVEALKNEPDDKVKAIFGEHVRKLHEKCNEKKLQFAKEAHESELFKNLQHGNVDFEDIVSKIIDENEEGGDVFEAFVRALDKLGLKDHPGAKVVVTIGGLLTDAACELKLDGYFKAVGKVILQYERQKEGMTGEEDDVRNRTPFTIRNIVKCCRVMRYYILHKARAPGSLMLRAVRLIFDAKCSIKEASFVKNSLGLIAATINLRGREARLKRIVEEEQNEVIAIIKSLHDQGKEEEADLLLGKYVLRMLRKGTLVTLLLPDFLKHKPSPGNRPPPGNGSPHDKRNELGPKGDESSAAFIEDAFPDTLQGTSKEL